MDVFGYTIPNMLLKFSNVKEHLEDIGRGQIYMNESGFFRKLEDQFRGDQFDGRCPISLDRLADEYMELRPEDGSEGIRIPIKFVRNFTVGFQNDDKIPLFCATALSQDILYKKTDTEFAFRQEFIQEMQQFGKYFAIFSASEFIEKMSVFVEKNHMAVQYGPVDYVEIHKQYDIEMLNEDTRPGIEAFFKKDVSYRWQNEWRIILLGAKDAPPIIPPGSGYFIANIGTLNWFHIMETKDLLTNTIQIREVDDAKLQSKKILEI